MENKYSKKEVIGILLIEFIVILIALLIGITISPIAEKIGKEYYYSKIVEEAIKSDSINNIP